MAPILSEIASDISEVVTAVYNPQEGDHDFLVETAEIRLDPIYHEFSFDRLLNGEKSNLIWTSSIGIRPTLFILQEQQVRPKGSFNPTGGLMGIPFDPVYL